jgi:hypothetical protein
MVPSLMSDALFAKSVVLIAHAIHYSHQLNIDQHARLHGEFTCRN